MKEFKKWQKIDCLSRECLVTDHGEIACIDCKDLTEVGWRAALKWVLNEMDTNEFKANGELQTSIKEEINED